MNKIHPKFRKDYPYRVTDWRWQCAGFIVSNSLAVDDSIKDDTFLDMAIKFRKKMSYQKSDLDIGVIYDEFPILFPMWEIYDEASYRKAELEARILGGEAFDSIAKKMGFSVPQVVAYEAIFFNVTDRLENKSYIFHTVLGFNHEQVHRDLALRWKLLSYCAGYEVFEKVIYLDLDLSVDEKNIDDTIFRELQTKLLFKLRFSDHYNEAFWKTMRSLLSYYTRILNIRVKDAKAAEIDEAFNYLRNALQNIEWSRTKYVLSDNKALSLEDLRGNHNG